MALLALQNGKAVEREWLVERLWPESDAGALSLRQSLWDLRRALGPEAQRLEATSPRTLRLDVVGVDVDVLAFDQAIRRSDTDSLQRAVTLYRGPLLEGCDEPWAYAERQERSRAFLSALTSLSERAEALGDHRAAAEHLRRALAEEPLREEAVRSLMRAREASGDPAGAMEAYQEFRRALQRHDPRRQPAPETVQLASRVRERLRATVPSALPPLPGRSLPHPLTEMLGREDEVRGVLTLLTGKRLATLTGPGGVGKTRLALAVAEAAAHDHADGACFVDLSPLTAPAMVPDFVASALGVRDVSGRAVLETLTEALRHRSLLLVLDNCEHLLDACAHLAHALLSGCLGLHLLATSRQALRLTGESIWRVPPLPTPEEPAAGAPIDLQQIQRCASVRLFVDRAGEADRAFSLTVENAADVAALCRHLDGLPLAIELAAARVREMPPATMLSGLEERFHLLSRGSRVAPPRHRTLRALIDWSYDLLSTPGQDLFQRVSVFAGGWTAEFAQVVCAGGNLEAVEVPALLAELADGSLLAVDTRAAHYRLLETVRQYAYDRLSERGDAPPLRERHARFFLGRAEEAAPRLTGPEQAEWFRRLEVDHDNLRLALEWSRTSEHASQEELRLVVALALFWARGHLTEGRRQCEAALARTVGEAASPIQSKALNAACTLALCQSDDPAARNFAESALEVAQEVGDLGQVGVAEGNLGRLAVRAGSGADAEKWLGGALTKALALGGEYQASGLLLWLGHARRLQGDLPGACRQYEAALGHFQGLGSDDGVAFSLASLAAVACTRGDHVASEDLHRQSLVLFRRSGDKRAIVLSLRDLARSALARTRFARAARLLSAFDKFQMETGLALADEGREQDLVAVRIGLDADAFTRAWDEGTTMTFEQALEYAEAEEQANDRAVATGSLF